MRTILCAAICLLTGCLARPHLDKQSFIFAPPSPPAVGGASAGRVLGIRTLQVAALFDGLDWTRVQTIKTIPTTTVAV